MYLLILMIVVKLFLIIKFEFKWFSFFLFNQSMSRLDSILQCIKFLWYYSVNSLKWIQWSKDFMYECISWIMIHQIILFIFWLLLLYIYSYFVWLLFHRIVILWWFIMILHDNISFLWFILIFQIWNIL